MSELIKLNIFGSVENTNSNDSEIPEFSGMKSQQEMLDYMVLIMSRYMTCSVAFKGGYLLNKLLDNHSRQTSDVDLSIARKGDYEQVKNCLCLIANKLLEQGCITAYRIKDSINVEQPGGIDMYDKSGRKILGVDVGLHNIGYGIRHYDLDFTEIDDFTIGRMLADKLIAITSQKRFRRTKDLYDFWAITNFFDIDGVKLSAYIECRGGAEWENIPFEGSVIQQYQSAWDKLDLRAFDGTDSIEKPGFMDALNRYYDFALELKLGNTEFRWEREYGRRISL